MTSSKIVKFELNTETKNCYRFEEKGYVAGKTPRDQAVIGSLYINKGTFAGKPVPEVVVVNLTWEAK